MNSNIVDSDFTMIGGKYRCRRHANGKYSIYDVEFFSTHEKGENGVNFAADDDWLKASFKQMQADYPRHALPANIFHHDDEEVKSQPIRIAYIQPAKTGMCYVNSRDRLTIYVHLHGVEERDFLQVCDLQLPYRSAEISSFRNHQFRALALLKDQIGYFKYAILSPGIIEGDCRERDMAECVSAPLVNYRASADADNLVLLYRYGGNVKTEVHTGPDMVVKVGPAETANFAFGKEKNGGDEKKDSGEEKKEGGDGKPPFGEKKGGEDAKAGMGGDEKDADGNGIVDGEERDPQQVALISLLTSMNRTLQTILTAVSNKNDQNDDKAPSQDKGSEKEKQDKKYSAVIEEEASVKTESKEVEKPKQSEADANAAMKAEIESDAKYAAKCDEAESAKSKLNAKDLEVSAVEELTAASYRLTKQTKEKIAKYAAKGEEATKEFVKIYKEIALPDPPQSVDAGFVPNGKAAEDASLPDEVLNYKASNPKEFAFRKSVLSEFNAYRKTGGTMTFDHFAAAEKARVANGGR